MWNGRFFPLSHIDNAILLKIFKSFDVLKAYLILHFIFLLSLVYFAFDFIPKNRRLVLLSLIAISPPIINIYSSAIYSERNILLLLVAGVFFFRLGIKGVLSAKLALFFSLSSLFVSLYFKETTILYVASFIGLYFILKNFESLKRFNFSVLLTYLKKPLDYVETLFLIPCLLWLVSFFLLGGEVNPEYVAKRDNNLAEYAQQNAIELFAITIIFFITLLRARFDVYTVLILSCAPMVLYCLLISQSMGAYNIFTYYNYLIYCAFSLYVVSTVKDRFIVFAPLTIFSFTLISLFGFFEFTEKVEKRNKVLNQAVDLIREESLNISIEEPWKERNLARFILYKAKQGHINHLTDHSLFCKDVNLYNDNTECTINEQPYASRVLIKFKTSSDQQDELKIVVATR